MTAEHFNSVVVGSGFGGSVMAYRLAAAGHPVCVLERGKPYPPGSFPRSPHAMQANFWDPSEGGHGMFDVWSFHNLEAIVSSGLGGGSLIYANVLIRKDEKWFVTQGWKDGAYEYWPVTRADLDPHYCRVEKVLNAQTYPLYQPPYDRTAKTLALKHAAGELGLHWYLPKLAVTFANTGKPPIPGEKIEEAVRNLHDRDRTTCRLCGECDVGCNYGSKNTLDYNYLTLAKEAGAEIRMRCEVRGFRPRDCGGYEIEYVHHLPENEGRKTKTRELPLQLVTADRLILAAGTLGTNYLLLKSRGSFRGIGPVLGQRFSGNGDVLSFVSRARDRGGAPTILDPSHGPVITSTIRVPDQIDGGEGRGFYLQDAGYPDFVNWLLEAAEVPGVAWRFLRFAWRRLSAALGGDRSTEISEEIAELLGSAELSACSMPLLGMGRDVPTGVLRLQPRSGSDEPLLEIDWDAQASRDYYARVLETSRRVAEAMGGRFHPNPLAAWLRQQVTVHPLGGCAMGRNPNEGVVDSWGQVFNHPSLYIADGSVMPGPVGPNPSLTIAALADRFADGIIGGRRLS